MIEDLTLFAMARRTMGWLSRREEVLAQNIANANTPEYKAKDLSPLDFKNLLSEEQQPVRAVVTNPMHISPPVEQVSFKVETERRPEESKPDGNDVLLEEQMKKVGDVRDRHTLAANLMQANTAMIKTAIGQG